MGKTIHLKSGADPILITAVILTSIQYRFGLFSWPRLSRGSHTAFPTSIALIPQSKDLANTGLIPPAKCVHFNYAFKGLGKDHQVGP